MVKKHQCSECDAELPVGSSANAKCPKCLLEPAETGLNRLARLPSTCLEAVGRSKAPIAPPPVLTKQGRRSAPGNCLILPAFRLLTRRLSTPNEEVPGFPDHYFCARCKESFVLGWKPAYSPLTVHCDVVPKSHPLLRGRDPKRINVFCPKCGGDCRTFGLVPHPQVPVARPADIRVIQSWKYPLPDGVPSGPVGRALPTGPRVENIVVFVSGKIPGGLDARELAFSLLAANVYPKLRNGFRVFEAGGSRVHVLRVNKIVNKPEWLIPVVKRELYQAEDCSRKTFAVTDLLKLEKPLREAAFCVVFPYRPRSVSKP